MTNLILVLFVALCALQVLDVYSTYNIIKSGKGYESNPVMAWCIEKLGLGAGLVIPKGIVVMFLDYLLFFSGVPTQTAALIMGFGVVGYSYVVRNNFKILNG